MSSDLNARNRCDACRQEREPYVRFTGGGFVCEDCANYLPIGCRNCGHHYGYVRDGECKTSVGRLKPGGMWYGPCGCRNFIAPEELPPLPPALVARLEGETVPARPDLVDLEQAVSDDE